jgi:thymidylate synthase
MINIEEEYIGLLSGILYGGKSKKDRTGIGTKSVFGRIIYHDMALGFPILTTKKININHVITELLWIVNGRTDLNYLHDHNVRYWDDDYARSGRSDGELGPIYGKQWRNFFGVDQLTKLVNEIKKNPTSRRLLVSAWNPAELDSMVLPPCHYNFQVYCNDNTIDLMWQQRSVDVFLGLPYDISIYGLLLELLAKGTNLKAGRLIGSFGDCHLYKNHLEQAEIQLKRKKLKLPSLQLNKGISLENNKLFIPTHEDIKLLNYKHLKSISAKLNTG